MRPAHLRSIDLNLLLPLQALLEERNVTRAARRINLSQSATSRALERLRVLLSDHLLVRTQGKYQLTPRGNTLLQELELLLPRLERLWTGEDFAPSSTFGRVRLAMTDYAATVFLPEVIAECHRKAPGLTIEVTPWHERSHEDLSASTVDLVLSPLATPELFRVEPLFEEKFVCLVGRRHPFKRKRLSLTRYLSYKHVSVETQPKQQNLIDRALAEAGLRRRVSLHLPYVVPAVRAIEDTDLILTIPTRLAPGVLSRYRVRQLGAPSQIPGFQYVMVWHPRLETEALHSWFRSLIRQVCRVHFVRNRSS